MKYPKFNRRQKFTIFFSLILLYDLTNQVHGQTRNDSIPVSKNSLFIEYAGTGGYSFSMNYDRIVISKEEYFLSLRGGIGFMPAKYANGSQPYISTPIEVSNLFGYKHYFEIGVGCSYIYGLIAISCIDNSFGSRCASSSIYFIPRVGYRFQSLRQGLFLKIGFTPFVRIVEFNKNPVPAIKDDINNMKVFPLFGLSVGYTFKNRKQ